MHYSKFQGKNGKTIIFRVIQTRHNRFRIRILQFYTEKRKFSHFFFFFQNNNSKSYLESKLIQKPGLEIHLFHAQNQHAGKSNQDIINRGDHGIP